MGISGISGMDKRLMNVDGAKMGTTADVYDGEQKLKVFACSFPVAVA